LNRAALLKLSQWFSPAYPVGAYAYSHGLEWVISAGEISNAAQLADWLKDVLHNGSGRNDTILLAHAFGAKSDKELAELAELAAALAPSLERRLETQAQGQAFARTTNLVWPGDLPDMAFPVAVGAAARRHDLPLELTIALYLQAFVSSLVSVAVRFMPLGQTEGQIIVAELSSTIETAGEQALGASLDDLGGCVFRADMASMLHETLATRIFRS
jgi:urease accessory protein